MSNNVNNRQELEWGEVFLSLLDTSPQVINGLIHKEEDVRFLQVWHDYGMKAGGPERTWATKYGKNSGLAPQGIIAMECLRRGLAGEQWKDSLAALHSAVQSRKQPNGRWLKMANPTPTLSPKTRHSPD